MAFTPEEEAKLRELIAMMPDLRTKCLTGAGGSLGSIEIATPCFDSDQVGWAITVQDATGNQSETVRGCDGD